MEECKGEGDEEGSLEGRIKRGERGREQRKGWEEGDVREGKEGEKESEENR